MTLPQEIDANAIWNDAVEDRLGARLLQVPIAPGSKITRNIYLTKSGWVLGKHEELREILTSVNMDGLWKSELAAAWRKSNKLHKGKERRMRFGRRVGDIMEPGENDFGTSTDTIADRTATLASLVHRQDHYQYASKNAIPRELEQDKAKASRFAGLSVESHHVLEKVIFQKLDMVDCGDPFTINHAVCVALNAEFHRRFMALRVEDRQEFSPANTKSRKYDAIIADLHALYEEVYKDSSLEELRKVARFVNGAALWAMKQHKRFGA